MRPISKNPSYLPGESPERDAWYTAFFIENHLDHLSYPDTVATPEQVRFMIYTDDEERYYPCSDRMFEAIMNKDQSDFLQGKYNEALQRVLNLIKYQIEDKIEQEYLASLIKIKFRHETRDGIMIPSRLEKRLIRIFINRTQIEAVVAHEAGHIAADDSLSTTVISSLSEIYEESLYRLKISIKKGRGRGVVILLLLYIVLWLMHFLSTLLRYFISREREYCADAIAVRLTRNPLSLAEALKLISTHWRGAGSQGERLEAIFIVNPRYSNLEEREGLISDIFHTHPPIKKRINILLDMAHLDEKTLEDNLKNLKRVSPVAVAEFKPRDPNQPKRWFVFQEEKWLGPFLLDALRQLPGLKPDQWVKLEGQDAVMPAYADRELKSLFGQAKQGGFTCPHCKKRAKKILSPCSFKLVGGGWYADGYSSAKSSSKSSDKKTD